MCYVVAWNVTNEICKVMFLGELIDGFSGFWSPIWASQTCIALKLYNMNLDYEFI
jgi:hypothetical protein